MMLLKGPLVSRFDPVLIDQAIEANHGIDAAIRTDRRLRREIFAVAPLNDIFR